MEEAARLAPRPAALQALAARLGVDLDRRALDALSRGEADAPALVRCAADAGIAARALHLEWGDLLTLAASGTPTLLVLRDGGAAILEGAAPDRLSVRLRDPGDLSAPPSLVDRQRLEGFWERAGVVLRSGPDGDASEAPFGMRWIWQAMGPDARILRDIGLAAMVMSVLALTPPLVFMSVADRVLLYQSFSTLSLFAAIIAVVVLFDTLLGWAKAHLTAVLARRAEGRMSLFTVNRLLRLPLDFFERTPAGEIQSRVFQIFRVREFLTGPLFRTFLDLVTLVAVVPVLFIISPTLSWAVMGLAGAIMGLILLFRPAIRRATRAAVEAERRKVITLVETVQGMRTVKALAIEAQRAEAWNRDVAASLRAQFEAQMLANRLQALSTPLERLFYTGPMLLGALLVLRGSTDVTIGALFAFMMLSGRAAAPLVSLTQLMNSFEQVRMSLGEASAVLNHPPERAAAAAGVRPRLRGGIAFRGVSFAYPGTGMPALKDVSFEAPAGTVLGLVGRSGSGKSTVTRLLQALSTGYSGLIKLDGVEMRELDLAHLRSNLGVVLQENFMFRGTIRDNVVAGRPGISFERVIQACRMAGAEEFIERLPRSYETMIEEGSPNLSGGQKQRLAIARALVTDPPILIFDEATSALDPESEAIVNGNLRRLAHGRTVVMVSHRLSSLMEADRILVLERGEVAGFAPHRELLRTTPVYRHLWLQQHRDAARTDDEPDHAAAS